MHQFLSEFFFNYPLTFAVYLATAVAAASKVNSFLVLLGSLGATYFSFIVSMGGLSSEQHFASGVGWGILFMVPASVGCVVATAVGKLARGLAIVARNRVRKLP